MAVDISSKGFIQSMLECCICTEEFKDPRILPCIHSFCFNCLELTWKDKQPGESTPCPLCRTEFRIPNDGIEGIHKSFFIENLITVQHLLTSDGKLNLCDACLEDSVDSCNIPPIVFCVECNQKLCGDCCRSHKKIKAVGGHQLIDLKNKLLISQATEKFRSSFCNFHEDKQVEMYCFDCQSVICVICFAENHHEHKCTARVGKVVDDLRSQLECSIRIVSDCLSESKKELSTFCMQKDLISLKTLSLEKRVSKLAQEIKEMVNRHEKELLQEINLLKLNDLEEIERMNEETIQHLEKLENYKRHATEIKDNGSDVEICRNFKEMMARSKELETNHLKHKTSRSKLLGVDFPNFIPNSAFESFLQTNKNVIGRLGKLVVIGMVSTLNSFISFTYFSINNAH